MLSFQGKEKGFTFLELVIVIVMIGILATTALPKISSIINQARSLGKARALGAAFASGKEVAHSAWLLKKSPNVPSTVEGEFGTINLNSIGYPSNSSGGSLSGSDCLNIFNSVMNTANLTVAANACTSLDDHNNSAITFNSKVCVYLDCSGDQNPFSASAVGFIYNEGDCSGSDCSNSSFATPRSGVSYLPPSGR